MRSLLLIGFAFALAGASCGSDVVEHACAPGHQVACTCTNGASGAQTCNEAGAAFDACVCEGTGTTGSTTGTTTTGGASGSGGDGAAGASTGGSANTGGAGAAGAGGGSTGGGGSAGGGICSPGETTSCYSGPASTLDVGACHAGTKTCSNDGSAWSACAGEVMPVVEDCATAIDEDCSGTPGPCAVSATWSKRFGDAANYQGALGVVVDPIANVTIGGTFTGTMDFSPGPMTSSGLADVYLAQFSSAGTPLWSKHVAGQMQDVRLAGDAQGRIVVATTVIGLVDFGGGLVLGSDQSPDIAVVQLDASGNQLWANRWVSSSFTAYVQALHVAPAGDVYVAGYYAGSIDVGCGPMVPPSNLSPGVFVTKLSPTGACVWSKSYGGWVTAGSFAVDSGGDVWVAGTGSPGADFGGGPVGGNSGFVFLERSTSTGAHLFTKTWPGISNKPPRLVAVPGGTLAMTGSFTVCCGNPPPCGMDFGNGPLLSNTYEGAYVVMVDSAATALWSKTYGPGSTSGQAIALDAAGKLVLTGRVDADSDFGLGTVGVAGGVYVLRLETNGDTISADVYDGAQTAELALDASGHVVIAGAMYGTADFGNGPLVSAGGSDAYVASFAP